MGYLYLYSVELYVQVQYNGSTHNGDQRLLQVKEVSSTGTPQTSTAISSGFGGIFNDDFIANSLQKFSKWSASCKVTGDGVVNF